jgi:peptidoglycan/LPS O-acetylase OafA/YrhL
LTAQSATSPLSAPVSRCLAAIGVRTFRRTMIVQSTKLPERNLDILRAIAVLCVLADHVIIAATAPGNVAWGWLGRAGVLIFFVHTALVLMSSIERSGDRRDGWPLRFYVRRAFRIYPLAIAAILLAVALRIPAHTPHVGLVARFVPPDPVTFFSNLLLAQNLTRSRDIIGVLWTLPIEVQMYLALPLCYLVARRSVAGVAGLIALGAIAGMAWVAQLNVPGLWRLTMLIFVPCFLSGVLAYALLRHRVAPRISGGLFFLLVAIVLAGFFAARARYEDPLPQWAFCLALGLLIPFGREISQSPISRAGHVIAKYSYGIYLLHLPLLWIALVPFRAAPVALQWTIFAVLMGIVPWIAFHLIERPGIRLGQRLVQQPMPAATPVGAP